MPRPARVSVKLMSAKDQVELWWRDLLQAISGSRMVIQNVTLIRCNLVGEKGAALTAEATLVPSVIIRGRMPYEGNQRHPYNYPAIRVFFKKVSYEVEHLTPESELGQAMTKGAISKCVYELIDTGNVRGTARKLTPTRLAESKVL